MMAGTQETTRPTKAKDQLDPASSTWKGDF